MELCFRGISVVLTQARGYDWDDLLMRPNACVKPLLSCAGLFIPHLLRFLMFLSSAKSRSSALLGLRVFPRPNCAWTTFASSLSKKIDFGIGVSNGD